MTLSRALVIGTMGTSWVVLFVSACIMRIMENTPLIHGRIWKMRCDQNLCLLMLKTSSQNYMSSSKELARVMSTTRDGNRHDEIQSWGIRRAIHGTLHEWPKWPNQEDSGNFNRTQVETVALATWEHVEICKCLTNYYPSTTSLTRRSGHRFSSLYESQFGE